MHLTREPRTLVARFRPAAIPASFILISALVGGLAITVALAGRAMPATATLRWGVIAISATALLALWGLLFSHGIGLKMGLSMKRAVWIAAGCHAPLLVALPLISRLYTDDAFNYLYSASPYGLIAYQPLTIAAVIAVPALCQAVVLATLADVRAGRYLAVAAPVTVALFLRGWHADWQLPYLFHNDERAYILTAIMGWAHGDPNPHRFLNPSFMFYLDLGLFNLLGGDKVESLRVFAEALGRDISDPSGMYPVVWASRLSVATLGSATVTGVYLATKELFDRKAALLASWFLAVSFLHVRDSHYGTNDVAAVFFIAISFLFAARIYRRGHWSDYLWAGFLGGVATSTKYNAGLFFLPIVVAHFATYYSNGLVAALSPRALVKLMIGSGAISALGFLLVTPFSVIRTDEFIGGFRGQLAYGALPWWGQELTPTWWLHLATLAHGYGWIPMVLAVVGAVYLTKVERRAALVLLVFPVVYFAFMAGQQLFFTRFAIPMLPFLAILSGIGMAWLLRLPVPMLKHRGVALALVALALAQPSIYSIRSDILTGTDDTRVVADRWISENLPENGPLLVDEISDLRESQGWPSRLDLRGQRYLPTRDLKPWTNVNTRPAFVAFSSWGPDGLRRGGLNRQELPDVYEDTERYGERIAVFSEGGAPRQTEYSIDDTYTPFWHLWERERPGPTVEIYRFDEGD